MSCPKDLLAEVNHKVEAGPLRDLLRKIVQEIKHLRNQPGEVSPPKFDWPVGAEPKAVKRAKPMIDDAPEPKAKK